MGPMSLPGETPTLILGAGPAGLAVAGRLRLRALDFEMMERSDRVASAWHDHYDRLHLHTVKELSHLPHRPFPPDYPRYVSRDQLIAYYEEYARTFDIRPHFGREVGSVRRKDDGGFITTTSDGDEISSKRVVVATGTNRLPHRPSFPGEEDFAGTIMHSHTYRNPERFGGGRVLVVGMGNTGAEIALDLAEQGIEVAISVRGPVNVVPREVLGRPTQLTARALSRLPEWLADRIGVALRRLTVGDLSRWGIETPQLPPTAQLRERGKTPVIDVGTLSLIKAGRIEVRGRIERMTDSGVVFVDGQIGEFDHVILATGYRPGLDRILGDGLPLPDPERPPVVGGRSWEGLYFVGFDNHRSGGILGTIFEESEQVVDHIHATVSTKTA